MPRSRSRRRDQLTVQAEINITNLVDVAFTLLVIFIITAPVLQGGVEVNVPQADVQSITSTSHPFFVTVKRDGTIDVGETPVSLGDFRESFPQLVKVASPKVVYIRGDSSAIYGQILPVIATVVKTAKDQGFRYALVAEPLPPGRE